MSKAILEFDAPESCAACPLNNDDSWCEVIKNHAYHTTSRHPECPLRVVDGQVLKEKQ